MLIRVDDAEPARIVPGGEEATLADLERLGLRFDEGPMRQSERGGRYGEAAAELGPRSGRVTLLRERASVVDDGDLGITRTTSATTSLGSAGPRRLRGGGSA
jgi:tRNA synthetase class I (E and Q)